MNIKDLIKIGLPEFAVNALKDRGITSLEPLQEKAIKAGLFKGENLVVMAPTSSGKTLVGELAALQHAISRSGSVILTSHKALAYEKYITLRESYSRDENFFCHTTIATGDEVTEETVATSVSLTVATYEKWYHLLLDRPDQIQRKSLIIVDELQMVGDKTRGGILEALLTWIRLKSPDSQIIGLSATIPNPNDIAGWLKATCVTIDQRPVPLIEQIWSQQGRYQIDRDTNKTLTLNQSSHQTTQTLQVIQTLETDGGLPAIIFCITKNDAQDLARQAAELRVSRPNCETLVNELDESTEGNPITRVLRRTLPKGIAFHNANLSLDERRFIEGAFRDGRIDLLFATPTLSAGVNLPIKTALFDKCLRSWIPEYINNSQYMNMAGRAGRRGLQEEGQSILLARNGGELERYKRYLQGQPDEILSSLAGQNLSKVILQAVVAKIAESEKGLGIFFKASFHGYLSRDVELFSASEVPNALSELEDNAMIKRETNRQLNATNLGKATAASGVLPQTGKILFDRLKRVSATFEWSRREQFEKPILLLVSACKDLAPSVDNIILLFVHQHDDFRPVLNAQKDFLGLATGNDFEDYKRSLLSAACIWRYINNTSFSDLAKMGRYVSAGNVRGLASRMAWMLQAAASIENIRGAEANPELRRWLRHMAKRLEHGATDDTVELFVIARLGDVKGFGRTRAQRLVDNGFSNLSKLLEADIQEIARLLQSMLRATLFRKAVILYLDQPSKHFQIEHMNRAATIGYDPKLIENVYNSLGTDFDDATLALLRIIYPKARKQDMGRSAEPDLAIPLKGGLLVIECKTKRSEDGTINLHAAFEVKAKAAHLDPVGMVTLGKPAFDRLPIERAVAGGLCLITHVTLCEAVIQIWEGTLDSKALLKLLRRPGYLDVAALDAIA